MKKFLLILSAALISIGCVYAASPAPDATVRNAIAKYKYGNYSGCIQTLEKHVVKKPTALSYYYLGMSYSQAGRIEDAISNYTKSIDYATKENNNFLKSYAQLGKKKLEAPDLFESQDAYTNIDMLIQNKALMQDDTKKDLNLKHLEYLRNEMNSGKEPHF